MSSDVIHNFYLEIAAERAIDHQLVAANIINVPPEISSEISATIKAALANPGDSAPTLDNAADLSRDPVIRDLREKAYDYMKQRQNATGIATRIAIANVLAGPSGDNAEGLEQLSSARFIKLLHIAKMDGATALVEKLTAIISTHNEIVTSHLEYLLQAALEAEEEGDETTMRENLRFARETIGADGFKHNSDLAATLLNLPAEQLDIFMEFLATKDDKNYMILIALAVLERQDASPLSKTEAYRKISRYYRLKGSFRELVEHNKEFLAFLKQQTPGDKDDKDQLTEKTINNYMYGTQKLLDEYREHDPNYRALTEEEEFAFLAGILKGSFHSHLRREALIRIVSLCQNLEQDEEGEHYAGALLRNLRDRPEKGHGYENHPITKRATAALLYFKRRLGTLRPSAG